MSNTPWTRYERLLDKLVWIVTLHDHDVMDVSGALTMWKNCEQDRQDMESLLETGALGESRRLAYFAARDRAKQILQERVAA